MKIILIPTCSVCPHGTVWELDFEAYMCCELGTVNKTGNKTVLPECKLKDALHFIKDFAAHKQGGAGKE